MLAYRSTVRVSVLLALMGGLCIGTIAPTIAQTTALTIAQGTATAEIDRSIAEGLRLIQEGSAESLRKAIVQFEKALELARSMKDQDTQGLFLLALGRIHNDLGEKQKAISYYNRALQIRRAVNDRSGEATTLNHLGLVYSDLGEKQKAIEYYNQALQIRRAVGNRSGEATTLNNLGAVYSDLGEQQKAIEYYNQALPILRAVGNCSGEATTLNNLGQVYSDLGEKQKAIEYYNQALPILRAVGDRSGEATTLNNLGAVYSDLGEKQKAIEYFNQALPIYRAVGDRSGEATTLNNLGLVYSDLGEKQKAIEYYNQALPISRAVGNRSIEAGTLNNLGLVYSDLGEKQKAIEYYNQSLPILRAVGNRSGEATTLNNLGGVYSDLGEKQKAIEYFNQALPILRAVGNRSIEATTLNNLGGVYSDLGEKQKAIEYFNQALPILRAVGNRSIEATTLNNLGLVYSDLGEKQKAIEYYNQALPILRAVGNRSIEATTLNNLGLVYSDLGEKQKAIEYYNQALPILRAVGDRSGEATTLNNLGLVFNLQKQPELAIAFYKQSVNLYESLRQEIRTLPRETQEKYTSTVAVVYRALADLLLSQGRNREAQAILELLKVQEFQGYAANQDPKQPAIVFPIHPLEAAALKQFEQITTSRSSLNLATLTQLGQPLSQNADRITQDMNNLPIAIGNPSNLLKAKPNTILIQNVVVDDKIWVIWTNANGTIKTALVSDIPQAQLTRTVQTFRQQIGKPYSNLLQLQATSQRLYNWLIPPPLQAELASNPNLQLIFSLDHVTRYVPIGALYDGKQYLAQRHTLSNLITTDTDMTDRLAPQGRSPSILALGTTNAYPGFSSLPNVQAELDAIVKENNDTGIFPGTVRLNAGFTADSLRGNLDAYRVLHIATHGSFNPKSITASFLLLGNGDKLPITEIAGLSNLNSNHLVVLSACETGLSGVSADGSEISGISSYFLRRGAKSVMASLWAVNDASTALLMQQFYQRLSQGMTKAEAIQAVQQDFISGKLTAKEALSIRGAGAVSDVEGQPPPDSFSHPYFWAPFILVGNSL
jgi:CHAT domain-containing protein/Flp pilus assembly protein TadD